MIRPRPLRQLYISVQTFFKGIEQASCTAAFQRIFRGFPAAAHVVTARFTYLTALSD